MNIIGQTKLLSKIDMYYTMQYLPKTLMFLGPAGCGKHTIAKHIAEKFGLDFVEIEESVSAQDLEDYTHKTIDTLYLINLNKLIYVNPPAGTSGRHPEWQAAPYAYESRSDRKRR